MTGIATKAANSVFYKARMEAARTNEMLRSREGAAEVLGLDRTRIARIELGTIYPYPEEVVLMADAYNAPELMNYFCCMDCPIGKRTFTPTGLQELDRMTIDILAAVEGIGGVNAKLLRIVSDGKISREELPDMQQILKALQEVSKAASELQIYLSKVKGTVRKGERS